jgi:outer membrane receptor for Fe3+-dicitrate
VKGDYDLPFSLGSGGAVHNQFVFGGTFRLAHVAYVANFSAEAVSVYDLTGNPNLWRFNPVNQSAADAFPYTTAFGKVIYGVPGRDSTDGGNTGVSDLYDTAIFFQDRLEFTPKLSVLFGARIDALQDHTFDPLGGVDCSATCFTDSLPQKRTTGVYGLGDGNISVVYKPWDWVSGYLTFDWTQSTNANGGEGGVNAYTQVPDSTLMRSDGYLYEAGLKFNLINNKLFVGTAVFDQKHEIATGQGGTQLDAANIRGVEMELNYQPTRNLFATASYSYINTTLNNAPAFYDYPAQLGLNVDGAGLFAVFQPNQKFQDPDQPQHVFNFLANYKFENGLGLRTGMQVTGPIPLTASGYLDPTASATIFGTYVPQIASVIAGVTNSQGYYKAPVIPWQYTWNAATFYQFGKYTITLSVYNLTDQRNWQPSPSDYGNDFLVLSDPRTFEVRFQAKF